MTSVKLIFIAMAAVAACEKEDCIDETKINEDAVCVQIYDPVCGCDGITYSNSCLAENAGVTRWSEGECNGN